MNREHGVGTAAKALLLLIATTALLGAVYTLIHYVGSYIESTRQEGFNAGREAAFKEVGDRDNADLREQRAVVEQLTKRIQELEDNAEDEVNAAAVTYEEELSNANTRVAALTARVRAGELKLRDTGRDAQDGGSGGDAGTEAAPAPCPGGTGDQQEGTGELSREASGFLLGEAGRADGVVRKLNLCKETLTAYQKACNANTQ